MVSFKECREVRSKLVEQLRKQNIPFESVSVLTDMGWEVHVYVYSPKLVPKSMDGVRIVANKYPAL